MTAGSAEPVDWRGLWASGDLGRFCFISLGILLHASNETMVATVMPGLVADISGVEMVGWSLAAYEVGSIIAGAAAGRLVSYMALRTNMVAAALLYAAGAFVCATAQDMTWFLAGRFWEGFGGGALVALAFVSVERLFPQRIWPQLFAIISVVWGVAAFGGPLAGALISESASWRWAFGTFAIAGLGMAAITFAVLRGPAATRRKTQAGEAPPPFPYAPLACLAIAIMLIAVAGVNIEPVRSGLLLVFGLAGVAVFFVLDARTPSSRLFPRRPLDQHTTVGRGLIMVGAFSMATVTFGLYGPLILTTLHGIPLLTAGYIVAAEAIAWSILSILVANARPNQERGIILAGTLMITLGAAGFAVSVPSGSVPFVLACAIVQGGGFGIAWPFITRMIVAAAPADEQTIASSAIPALQRIGYAVGAAIAGIIANLAGFGDGLSSETARGVASWLFAAFVPFGLIGCVAALRLLDGSRQAAAGAKS